MYTSQKSLRSVQESPSLKDRKSLVPDSSDDNYSVGRRDSMSGSYIDFMNSSVYEEENSFNDDYTTTDTRGSTQSKNGRKLTDTDAKFVVKKDWQKNKKCVVCERVMDKLKVSRICAFGVCGDCSKKKVNDLRVCDECFVRQSRKDDEAHRNETVNMRGDKLVRAQDKLKSEKEELQKRKMELEQYDRKISLDSNTADDAIQKNKHVRIQKSSELAKKKEGIQQLKNQISSGKKTVNEKESKLNELKVKISALKLELSQKKSILEDRENEFATLKETVTQLQNRSKNEGQEPRPEVDDKVSFISNRSMSILTADKDGKYNISLQPVNI